MDSPVLNSNTVFPLKSYLIHTTTYFMFSLGHLIDTETQQVQSWRPYFNLPFKPAYLSVNDISSFQVLMPKTLTSFVSTLPSSLSTNLVTLTLKHTRNQTSSPSSSTMNTIVQATTRAHLNYDKSFLTSLSPHSLVLCMSLLHTQQEWVAFYSISHSIPLSTQILLLLHLVPRPTCVPVT